MKARAFIPLIILTIVLVILIVLDRGDQVTTPIEQQVGLHALLPENIDVTQVTRLIFFAGAHPQKRVALERRGDEWWVMSYFNSRALPERPLRILGAISEFKGEFRAEATDEQLASYDLSN